MSSLVIVVPRSQLFRKFSGISFLTASVFSSSLIVPNQLSYLSASLMNVLRISSNCSASFAQFLSPTWLIRAAHLDHVFDVFLRNLSVLALAAPFAKGSLVVALRENWHKAVSMPRSMRLEQPTDRLVLSILSTLPTRTNILSTFPSLTFGIRSMVFFVGLAAPGALVNKFCIADAKLLS